MKWLMMRLVRPGGISCAQVRDLAQAHLDGELEDGPQRDRLIAHLHRCRRCGVEAEALAQIKASLAAPPPADAVDRLTRFAAALPGSTGGPDHHHP